MSGLFIYLTSPLPTLGGHGKQVREKKQEREHPKKWSEKLLFKE